MTSTASSPQPDIAFDRMTEGATGLGRPGIVRPLLSNSTLVCIAIAWMATVDNVSLWSTIGERRDLVSVSGIGFSLTLFSALVLLPVLHTMGRHGTAYYRRVPQAWVKFSPYCGSKAPQDCLESEIVNAYDDTILCTDHVLASLLQHLDARKDAAFMLYASDHGESLGENGAYLHGLPKMLAPKAQTVVPMIAWFSDRFAPGRESITAPPTDPRPVSHDFISATLLGLFDVLSGIYSPTLDLFPDLPFGMDFTVPGGSP